MSETKNDLHLAEEENLAVEVSDDALEVAAGMQEVQAMYTPNLYCGLTINYACGS